MSLSFFHLVSSDQVTRPDLERLFSRSDELRELDRLHAMQLLKGRLISLLFFEPSTRTHLSFEAAAKRLGAEVLTSIGWENSSLKKGESIADTIEMVSSYSDAVVMRHPNNGSAKEASLHARVPFINAGDGSNEHPTQGLLDLYTIQKERGAVDGLHIAFVGDLKFGRTVHASLRMLCQFNNISVSLISPPALQLAKKYKDLLDSAGVSWSESTRLSDGLMCDVLYMTRIQRERFTDLGEYDQLKESYHLRATDLQGCSATIMHPLPRLQEIHTSVDQLPQAAYFRQAENGLYMRMALLDSLLSS